MEHVVDTYECEWKKAIEDPETLKRFRHFVNAEETDNNVVFVEERGQIRPATADEKAQADTSRAEKAALEEGVAA